MDRIQEHTTHSGPGQRERAFKANRPDQSVSGQSRCSPPRSPKRNSESELAIEAETQKQQRVISVSRGIRFELVGSKQLGPVAIENHFGFAVVLVAKDE